MGLRMTGAGPNLFSTGLILETPSLSQQLLVSISYLLLVVRPGAPIVAMPGAGSVLVCSILARQMHLSPSQVCRRSQVLIRFMRRSRRSFAKRQASILCSFFVEGLKGYLDMV